MRALFRFRAKTPRFLLWLAPVVSFWGATTLLDDTLTGIRARWGGGQRADESVETLQSICLTSPRPPRYVEKAFSVVCTSDIRRCPGPLEILLVPHVGVAVLVHAPIGEPRGEARTANHAKGHAQPNDNTHHR